MFSRYSSAPIAFIIVFERLWLAQTFKRITYSIIYKVVYLFENFPVAFIPVPIFLKAVRSKLDRSHFFDNAAAYASNCSAVKEMRLRLFSASSMALFSLVRYSSAGSCNQYWFNGFSFTM